jgi:hypothetical protein
MVEQISGQWAKGLAGNAGVYLASWHLSRAGFAVAITSRNMKGPDIIAISDSGQTFAIQVKAGSQQVQDIDFGIGPVEVREPWWIIVSHVMSDNPALYLLSRDEMQRNLYQDPGTRSGKPQEQRKWWLPATRLCRLGHSQELTECRDAWHKLV